MRKGVWRRILLLIIIVFLMGICRLKLGRSTSLSSAQSMPVVSAGATEPGGAVSDSAVEAPARAPEPVSPLALPDEKPETPAQLSAEVAGILSFDNSFAARSQAIRQLGRDLSADEVAALREFLATPLGQFPKMNPLALNSLKNDLLEVLMDQRQLPVGLGQQVVEMFNDPSTDAMWREYCLQFMAPLVEQTLLSARQQNGQTGVSSPQAEAGSSESVKGTAYFTSNLPPSAAPIIEAMMGALDERDQELAGTALLGLDRLAKKYEQFDREAVSAQAVKMAADPAAATACRITGLRVAASGGREEILPTARELAAGSASSLLRGAAITTLGEFGQSEDRELLKTLAASSNRQVAAAAHAALAKMEGKQ
jgi:hypothetical protein